MSAGTRGFFSKQFRINSIEKQNPINMKKANVIAILVLSIMAAGCGQKVAKTREPKREVVPAIELSNMDTTINPADDFFRYCNNNWLKNNPIPEAYSTYNAFYEIGERTEMQILEIINEVSQDVNAPQGSVAQKIRDFYNAGMDTVAIDKRGYSELLPYFERIDALGDKNELAALMGYLHSEGFGGFFEIAVGINAKNAEQNIMQIGQEMGLSLGDRDLYLEEDAQELLDMYAEHVSKMFQLTGTDSIEASKKAQDILKLEIQLAQNSMSLMEIFSNSESIYNNIISRTELQKATPNFNWDNYFDTVGAPAFDNLNLCTPDYIAALDKVILNTDFNTIKDYLKWKVIHGSATKLSSDLDEEHFNFYGRILRGREAQEPRRTRIVDVTSDCLGEAIGELYVEKYFPTEAKERVENLVANLRVALGERIKNLDWMSDETKARALHKLECMSVKVGYPDQWKDYSKLEVSSESYFQNYRRFKRFENETEMAKIGKPVDRKEWLLTPQTVNAHNENEMNEITFPAAMLQPPFFNMDADDAVNYGAIGMVIGHEMTHAFDDQGRLYDENGNMNDWWTEDDNAKFLERAAQLVKLFNDYQVRGYQINGELTIGENIADLGGLNIAWDAYQMTDEAKANQSIDGFTPAQRFFISYGTIWRNNSRDKYLERTIKSNEHSPSEARVNRALGSMPHFYEAFDIPEGSMMYIAPEERAAIW